MTANDCGNRPLEESRGCNERACEEWGEWTEWTDCSRECGGGGKSSRVRDCVDVITRDGCYGDSRYDLINKVW